MGYIERKQSQSKIIGLIVEDIFFLWHRQLQEQIYFMEYSKQFFDKHSPYGQSSYKAQLKIVHNELPRTSAMQTYSNYLKRTKSQDFVTNKKAQTNFQPLPSYYQKQSKISRALGSDQFNKKLQALNQKRNNLDDRLKKTIVGLNMGPAPSNYEQAKSIKKQQKQFVRKEGRRLLDDLDLRSEIGNKAIHESGGRVKFS